MQKEKGLKYRWMDAVLSKNGGELDLGPSDPYTRLLLLVLASHMDRDGDNCFPGTRALERETCMCRNTVLDRIRKAESEGWLRITERRGGRRGGVYHQYHPRFPDEVVDGMNQLEDESGASDEPLSEEGEDGSGASRDGSGARHDTEVVDGINLSSPGSSPESSPEKGGADPYGGEYPRPSQLRRKGDSYHRIYPTAFEEMWAAYPSRGEADNPKKAAYAKWLSTVNNGADPADLLKATHHYARWANDTGKAGTETVKQGRTFFGPGEHWVEWLEPQEGDGNGPDWLADLEEEGGWT